MFEVMRFEDGASARVARIVNTLDVGQIQLSESLARSSDHPDLEQLGDYQDMRFADDGSLI